MNGKKILITGGTGYIGSEIVRKLISQGNSEIALVVRDIDKAKKQFNKFVTYIECTESDDFKKNVEKFSPDIVVHLAAYSTSSDEPEEITKLIESNIIFTSNLLVALSNCNIELFINTGSFSEYYNNQDISPTYFYSATKTSARYIIEYYSKKNNFKFINAILFTVYGKKNSSKKIIDYAIDSLGSLEPVKMSDGKQILDFIYIDDVVNFYINVLLNYKNLSFSKIDYSVGTGKGVTIRDLVKKLEMITNKKANISWGANQSRKLDTIQACANIVIPKEELNWFSEISIFDGLTKYLKLGH